jgi:glycosyltransferase involved in cell wall biosynthesis
MSQKPRISLCMIVKDEEQFLPNCLKSVQSVVDEMIIVDTGSKDKTIDIAQTFGAKIYEIPWEDDFAKARNVSLEHATGDWILQLDADEQFEKEDVAILFSFIEQLETEAFFLKVINHKYDSTGDSLSFPSVRLWRNRPEYRFYGALHEQITGSIVKHFPNKPLQITPVRIHHYGYAEAVVQQKNKSERNLRIALAEVNKNPDLAFAHYNLAMEYARRRQLQEAIEEFQTALTLHKETEIWISSLFRNYASTLIKMRKFSDAIRILDRGLAQFPDYIDLLFEKATCHMELKEYPQAVGLLHQCIVTPENPKYPIQKGLSREKAYYTLGHCYMRLNRFDECLDFFKRAYQLNPQFKQPIRDLAALLQKIESQN